MSTRKIDHILRTNTSKEFTVNGVLGLETVIKTGRRDHPEDVEPMYGAGRHGHLLIIQMPSRRDVATCAY